MSTNPPVPIGLSDYDRLIALWRAAGLPIKSRGRDSRAAFATQLAGGTHFPIGIETADGTLVGAVLATHDGRKGWINRLAVHPDWRRQGLAKRLIEAAEACLHEQGIDVMAALIAPENDVSLALFLSSGYTEYVGLHYVTKRSSADS